MTLFRDQTSYVLLCKYKAKWYPFIASELRGGGGEGPKGLSPVLFWGFLRFSSSSWDSHPASNFAFNFDLCTMKFILILVFLSTTHEQFLTPHRLPSNCHPHCVICHHYFINYAVSTFVLDFNRGIAMIFK